MILKVHLSVQVLEAALLTVVFRFVSKLLGTAKDSTQVQRLLCKNSVLAQTYFPAVVLCFVLHDTTYPWVCLDVGKFGGKLPY